jgi:hypothetical protein
MNDSSEEESSLLDENDPCSDAWNETSVLGRLMEEGLFDEEGYADLEAALIRAVAERADLETLGVIIRIIERITLMLKSHVDPNNVYRVANLDDEQVAELDRRVRFCLLEISLGNAPDMSRWET